MCPFPHVYTCTYTEVTGQTARVLSIHHAGSKHQTQVFKLGNKYLYPPSPYFIFFKPSL